MKKETYYVSKKTNEVINYGDRIKIVRKGTKNNVHFKSEMCITVDNSTIPFLIENNIIEIKEKESTTQEANTDKKLDLLLDKLEKVIDKLTKFMEHE